MNMSGVSGMVRAALWFEEQLSLETLSIGREAFDRKDSCTLVTTGKWLAYHLMIDGGWLNLRVCLMDAGEKPELLLTVADGPKGWREVCTIVRLLEREEVRTLARPIELGGGAGPSGWVIG